MIRDGMKARGFILEGTGGGCEAFIRYQDDVEGNVIASVMVTRFDDPSVPDEMGESVTVGYYAGECQDECVVLMSFPSVWAFFDATRVHADNITRFGRAE